MDETEWRKIFVLQNTPLSVHEELIHHTQDKRLWKILSLTPEERCLLALIPVDYKGVPYLKQNHIVRSHLENVLVLCCKRFS